MAELVARGPDASQSKRYNLPVDKRLLLGREDCDLVVPWDAFLSRHHAELCWSGEALEVVRLPTAANPIFHDGAEVQHAHLHPGQRFVIGDTTFTLVMASAADEQRSPDVTEQTYSAQFLHGLRFRNADQRIEVLSRLPELISGVVADDELFTRLVNMLLAGMPRCGAVALVQWQAAGQEPDSVAPSRGNPLASGDNSASGNVQLLHWERRLHQASEFRPSKRLIAAAVARGESVLNVWGTGSHPQDAPPRDPSYTLTDNVDWAFCTPLHGSSCPGWAVYVSGRLAIDQVLKLAAPWLPADSPQNPNDLREDVKFTELVASTVSSLRHVQMLQRRQATLSQFFAQPVFEAMATADPDEVLRPRETEVTVLFCDLRGFSRQSERYGDNLMGLLERVSRALGVTTHHILERGGVCADFQGDAAMGFWGWPFDQPDKVRRACLAALAAQEQFADAASHPDDPLADFQLGIGLGTGRAVAGRIGTTDQVKVTVFGPVANRASRLEGMTRLLHASILLDEPTADAARRLLTPAQGRLRRVAIVKPYGMETPVDVHELLPPATQSGSLSDADLRAYEAALAAFLVGLWAEARRQLAALAERDPIAKFLLDYMQAYGDVPPAGFDGVIALRSKG
jgi:adenylate cyclase